MARRERKKIYWGAIILKWFHHLRDSDLSSSDYKVLFYLCEKMEFSRNRIVLRQKEIAQELHMDKGNVSKCISKLCEKQFIVKIPSGFMINPHLFYVGKSNPNDRDDLRDEFDEALKTNGLSPLFELNEMTSELEYEPYRTRY